MNLFKRRRFFQNKKLEEESDIDLMFKIDEDDENEFNLSDEEGLTCPTRRNSSNNLLEYNQNNENEFNLSDEEGLTCLTRNSSNKLLENNKNQQKIHNYFLRSRIQREEEEEELPISPINFKEREEREIKKFALDKWKNNQDILFLMTAVSNASNIKKILDTRTNLTINIAKKIPTKFTIKDVLRELFLLNKISKAQIETIECCIPPMCFSGEFKDNQKLYVKKPVKTFDYQFTIENIIRLIEAL